MALHGLVIKRACGFGRHPDETIGCRIDISVNWSSLASSPDLNALIHRAAKPLLGLKTRHQRVMVITGRDAGANLVVVPCMTTSALALMVLRQAAALFIAPHEVDSETFRTAETIVRAARVESVLQRLRTARAADVDSTIAESPTPP